MDTIPFKVHDPNGVLTETEGLVQIYRDRVRFQLETKDVFVGQFSKTTEVNIPIARISAAKLTIGWFITQLSLQVNDLELLKDFPGSRLGEIRLRFKRKHREDAVQFTAMLQEDLENLRLEWEEPDETAMLESE